MNDKDGKFNRNQVILSKPEQDRRRDTMQELRTMEYETQRENWTPNRSVKPDTYRLARR
jgi:hypothetical protein